VTKSSLFKVNYRWQLRIGFEIRKKGKHVKAEEFVKKIKEMHEEVKTALKKSQKEMTKYIDRNRKEAKEYKMGDRVLLSMKDLVWKMRNRKIKKLTEKFVGSYKIKKIISENTVELEFLVSMKIHPVVNVSRIALYQEQVERQKKIPPSLIEIERQKEYEIEKILNRRDVRGKPKYLVRWKGYMAEEDTWKGLENLGNMIELVEEFKKEIREKEIRRVHIRKEKVKLLNLETEMFKRSELLGKYTVKILFGWNDRKFEDEYLKKLERSWARWKGKGRQVSLEV